MRKRIAVAAVAALASLALLVPTASQAAAQTHYSFFCETSPGSVKGVTLKPGQQCNFWPVATAWATAHWYINRGGQGGVCMGVTRYPPVQSGQPLDAWGRPTGWS